MARPKPLTHPPIVEALLDLRTSIAGEPEMFKALAETLTDEFQALLEHIHRRCGDVQGSRRDTDGRVSDQTAAA